MNTLVEQLYYKHINNKYDDRVFIQLKLNASIQDYTELYQWRRNKRVEFLDWGILSPKCNTELFNISTSVRGIVFLKASSLEECYQYLEADISYYLSVLVLYKEKINDFIDKRRQYELQYFLGCYDKALGILKDIEDSICPNIWCIEARNQLWEAISSLEEDKNPYNIDDYIPALLETEKNNIVLKSLFDVISIKYNTTINNSVAFEKIESIINRIEKNTQYGQETNAACAYFKFITRMKPSSTISLQKNEIGDQLLLVGKVGLLDKYLLVERLIAEYYANCWENHRAFSNHFLENLSFAREKIKSQVIDNILVAYNKSKNLHNKSNPFLLELGTYISANKHIVNMCMNHFNADSDLFDVIVALAQYNCTDSLISKPIDRIIRGIQALYSDIKLGGTFLMENKRIDRLRQMYFGSQIGYGLNSLIENMYLDNDSYAQKSHLYESLYRKNLAPEMLILNKEYVEQFDGQNCYKWYYTRFYCKFIKSHEMINSINVVDPSLKKVIQYIGNANLELIEEEINNMLHKETFNNNDVYIIQQLLFEMCDRCIANNLWRKMCKLYFCAYIHSASLVSTIKPFVVKTPVLRQNCTDYFFVDYYFITQIEGKQNIEDSDRLYYCFDSILRQFNTRHPSEIPEPIDINEKHAWLFFLRNICTYSILRRDEFYDSDEERINERLAILNILINDDKYYSRYKVELLSEVNKFEKRLENYYLSSILDTKIDLSQINTEMAEDEVTRCFEALSIIPAERLDERVSEYKNGFQYFAQSYTSQLDALIGINIRHAFFTSAIRQVFQKYGFLSYEKGSDDESLKKFTKSMHSTISKFTDTRTGKWMIVTMVKGLEGINLYIDDIEIRDSISNIQFRNDIELNLSYRQLLDKKAYTALKMQSEKITSELLHDLRNDMILLQGRPFISECEIELVNQVKHIREWFIPKTADNKTIDLLTFSKLMKEKYSSIKEIKIDDRLDDYRMNRKMIVSMNLMFCNMVRNVEKHSGFSDAKDADFVINIIRIREVSFRVVFTNSISQAIDTDSVKAKIYGINSILSKKDHNKEIRDCFGTGFLKMRNGLEKYCKELPHIIISFDQEARKYQVTVDCSWA